jgi:polyketide synthase PksJ
MYRHANYHEELVFERIERDMGDPGCRLSYTFLISGELVVDELRDTLYALIFNHYQVALSTFVRKESGLYVYSSGMPENILDYNEIPQHLHSHTLDGATAALPENRLFCFTLTKFSECVHHLRLTFSHLIFDGQCYRIFCTLLTRLYGQGRVRLDPISEAQRPWRLSPGTPTIQSAHTIAFWKERLSRYPLGQTLSFFKAQNRGASPFVTVRRSLTGSSYAALKALTAKKPTTLECWGLLSTC